LTFKSIKILLLLIFFLLIKSSFAQDTQYWSQQYGTKSFYLGGAVIGNMLDLSATYYNPGAIAMMRNPEFLTGAKSVSLTLFKFNNGAGEGFDFESLRGDAPPDLFAGLFTFGKNPQDRLVYSYLVRKRMKFRVSSSADDLRDIATAKQGNDQYFGMTQVEWDVNETWVGFTYSKILNKNIGLGFTQYFSYFSIYTKLDINSQALTQENEIPATHLTEAIDTYNIKTLTKIGLFFDYSPITTGITLTVPSINLFGFGSYYSNNIITGQNIEELNVQNNYMDSYYLDDIKTYYPSSWTIGAGFSYKFGKSQVHFSIEWFAPVKIFKHMDLPAITNKSTGDLQDVDLLQEYKSVTNVGLGWQHIFNDHFSLFGGATTDFTSTPPGTVNDISLSDWDIYQISVGTVFSYKWIKMNTGLKYAFGHEKEKQVINYNSANLDNFLLGKRTIANIDYKSLKLVIGFSLRLFEKNDKTSNRGK